MKNITQTEAATALLFSNDSQAIRLLVEALKPYAIRVQICAHSVAAISLLNQQKFEAVIADMESHHDAMLLMTQMHLSAANRTAVSFAITASSEKSPSVVRPDSTFVLQRPLSIESIRSTFRVAFGMLVRERRRYYRCPIEVEALVEVDSQELICPTENVSEGGMAIRALGLPCLPAELPATVSFDLPGENGQFVAETRVCWRGKGDRVGLEFITVSRKPHLQEWLARKLDESLPESVVQLFRGTVEQK